MRGVLDDVLVCDLPVLELARRPLGLLDLATVTDRRLAVELRERCALLGARRHLDRRDVHGVRALGPVLGVVADLRALSEGLEAIAGDAGVVHEQVLALIVGRDEPEALLVAEPLHGSSCHLYCPPGYVLAKRGGCSATTEKRCHCFAGHGCPAWMKFIVENPARGRGCAVVLIRM